MTTASQTALLLMDIQDGVVARAPGAAELPGRLAPVAAAARVAGVLVVHVRAGFLPGHPEVGPRAGAGFAALKTAGAFTLDDPAAALHPDLGAEPGDVVVTKKRYSAFSGSELELVLRSQGVEHLVLAGIVTSGVVLSTLRQAADLDFTQTVLADGCLDYDPEVHRVLLEKVFPKQATVCTAAEWCAGLGGRDGDRVEPGSDRQEQDLLA